MPRTDDHTHTPFCLRAEGEPKVFVKKALALGMSAYGIADHAPLPPHLEHIAPLRMRCRELPDSLHTYEPPARHSRTPLIVYGPL